MSLLDSSEETMIMLDKKSVPDGYGSFDFTWVDGAEFLAALNPEETELAKIANAISEIKKYKVTTKKNITLKKDDLIKRKSDGYVFRILNDSKDNKTPNSAYLDMRVTEAEKVDLPV